MRYPKLKRRNLKKLIYGAGRRFAFRLALALGYPPRLSLSMLTPQQFAEWQAFYKIEPWGFQTDDMQFSFTRKMMADVMGSQETK